jgi:hypothetical protein
MGKRWGYGLGLLVAFSLCFGSSHKESFPKGEISPIVTFVSDNPDEVVFGEAPLCVDTEWNYRPSVPLMSCDIPFEYKIYTGGMVHFSSRLWIGKNPLPTPIEWFRGENLGSYLWEHYGRRMEKVTELPDGSAILSFQWIREGRWAHEKKVECPAKFVTPQLPCGGLLFLPTENTDLFFWLEASDNDEEFNAWIKEYVLSETRLHPLPHPMYRVWISP